MRRQGFLNVLMDCLRRYCFLPIPEVTIGGQPHTLPEL
jgi:hypothetical protein